MHRSKRPGWYVLIALVALTLPAAGQDEGRGAVSEEVRELKARLAEMSASHAQLQRSFEDLRGRVEGAELGGSALEIAINDVAAHVAADPTVVTSVADPLHAFGEFRVRFGWTKDRDFGTELLTGSGNVPPPGGVPMGGGGGQSSDDDAVDDVGSFVDARIMIGFDYQFDQHVWTRMSIDANGLFENGQTPGSEASGAFTGGGTAATAGSHRTLDEVRLYEGFIHFDRVFDREEFEIRLGRQEWVLGNEFQFGNNEYFSGETFDGVRFTWTGEDYRIHLLAAKLAIVNTFNSRDHPYPPAYLGSGFDDDELVSLYFEIDAAEWIGIDVYWIFLNGENGGSVGTLGNALGSSSLGDSAKELSGLEFHYHTLGLRLHGVVEDVVDGFDYDVELAYQTGDLDGTGVDVEGLALEAELGLTVDAGSHLRIFARFLWAQGADDDETGYIPLFGERHAYADPDDHTAYRARYGLMDVIPMDNVVTAQLGATFDPVHDFTVGATVLWAKHDEEVTSGLDDEIGWELDLFAEYRHGESAVIALSVGLFLPEEGAPLKNGGFAGNYDDVAVLVLLDTRVLF